MQINIRNDLRYNVQKYTRMNSPAYSDPYEGYSFYVDFLDGYGIDRVSGKVMETTLSAGRVNADGTPLGINVPAILDGKLNTFGQITNMLKWSEDISNIAWIKDFSPTVTAKTFTAISVNGRIVQSVTTVEGATYTLSFTAHVPEGNLGNYYFSHISSASLPIYRTPIPTLTREPKRYSLQILGKVGGGLVQFGFEDMNTSNWATVHISNFQLTQSLYQLPYVKTGAGPATTPRNHSQLEEGYKWPFDKCPKLFDSLDGKAEGPNLAPLNCCTDPDNDVDAVLWVSSKGAILASVDGGKTGKCLQITCGAVDAPTTLADKPVTAGNRFKILGSIKAGTSSTYRIRVINLNNFTGIFDTGAATALSTWGDISGTFTIPEGCTAIRIYCTMNILANPGSTIFFDDISIKKISPAQGTVEVDWTPMFDSAVLPLDSISNIVQCYSSYPLFVRKDINGVTSLAVTDATLGTIVGIITVSGTHYKLTIKYGAHPGYANAGKYQLIVTDGTTTWTSPIVNFDGSFNPTTYLSIGYSNTYWQQISRIAVKEANPWIV